MSGKVGIIIQARMSSSRFPGKTMKLIGKKPLIFYVINRLLSLKLPLIVCTSNHPTDDVLYDYLKNQGIDTFRGSLNNVLDRYISAAERFGITKIIRITADNPLVDFTYLKDSIELFKKFDYIDGIYENGLLKGTGFELVKLSELKKIDSKDGPHTEHVTLFLRENLEKSSKRTKLLPSRDNFFREDIRLTCDFPEDFQLLYKVFNHFHFRVDVQIRDVVRFLDSHPDVKNINSGLY